VELGEVCDAGARNGIFFGDGSGCSSTCTKEPSCRDAAGLTRACDPVCGDGHQEPSEGCDDGNLLAGDGCSATCTVEAGFTCTPQAVPETRSCSSGIGQCLALP